MPVEAHEREHEEARETRLWMLELRAQIRFGKLLAAGGGLVGMFIKWVA